MTTPTLTKMQINKLLSLITAKPLLALATLLSPSMAMAEGIEHQGDRYIINVDELDLCGDETLYELLLMCPDLLVDQSGATATSTLLGNWAVRIDNLNIPMNQETVLEQLKACDIQQVKICNYPAVMKGRGGLGTVIDVKLRRRPNGTDGKVALEGDTYGEIGGYTHAFVQRDNMQLLAAGQGAWGREKSGGVTSHELQGDAYAHLNWDMTSKDNLVVMLGQQFAGEGVVKNPWEYDRTASIGVVYTRSLSDNGAYALLQANADYSTNKPNSGWTHSTNPLGIVELGFPMFRRAIYVTAGIEAGYSAQQHQTLDITDKSRYDDIYAQVDWSVGRFTFSVGDRIRAISYWLKSYADADYWEHTTSNHAYHVMAMYKFDKAHSVKGTFARRYYNPSESDFFDEGIIGTSAQPYTSDFIKYKAYQSELDYTYTTKDLIIGAQVKNVRQDIINGHDNTLGAGVTGWFHCGPLRTSAGVHYYHQKSSLDGGPSEYKNYVVVKLAPSLELPADFRFSSTVLYSSRKLYDYSWYAYNGAYDENRGNVYVGVSLEKELGEHWELEGCFHNIASQRMGHRGATVGVTYYW